MKVGLSLFMLAGAGFMYQIIAPHIQPPPIFMALPQVSLIDQNGHRFDLDQTRGKVVLLSPIYTNCPDICPLSTAKMKQIQERLQAANLSNQVQLVTFTVDPDRDQPAVIKQFAASFNVDPTNWVFLTGESGQISVLIKSLGLYVERVYYVDNTPISGPSISSLPTDTPYLVNHTDRLFLVDRQGNVRALLPGSRSDVNEVMRLIQQVMKLQKVGE